MNRKEGDWWRIENELSHLSTIIKSPKMPRVDKLKTNAMAYYSLHGKSVISLFLGFEGKKSYRLFEEGEQGKSWGRHPDGLG